jgi:hypothetical protein
MISTIESRDGALYIVDTDYSQREPMMYRTWFALGVPASKLEREERTHILGKPVTRTWFAGQPVYRDIDGHEWYLPNGGLTMCAFNEEHAVPQPRVRGNARVRWHYNGGMGYWQRETARGWIAA